MLPACQRTWTADGLPRLRTGFFVRPVSHKCDMFCERFHEVPSWANEPMAVPEELAYP